MRWYLTIEVETDDDQATMVETDVRIALENQFGQDNFDVTNIIGDD